MGAAIQKRIVVARYKEDITWLDRLPADWIPVVIQKQTEELEGDIPNAGREPASFLFAVARAYDQIKPDDVWAFVQGTPFDHCPNFLDKLEVLSRDLKGYERLGGDTPKYCDENGGPDHPNIPLKELYEKWLGRPCPKLLKFSPGGQFMVRGQDLLRYPREWYVDVMDDVTPAWNCYVFERIWGEVYRAV